MIFFDLGQAMLYPVLENISVNNNTPNGCCCVLAAIYHTNRGIDVVSNACSC